MKNTTVVYTGVDVFIVFLFKYIWYYSVTYRCECTELKPRRISISVQYWAATQHEIAQLLKL
jgi:hypothetical protein